MTVATFSSNIDKVTNLRKEFEHDDMLYIECVNALNLDEIYKFYLRTRKLFGNPSILINNAAISGPFLPVSEISKDEIINTIQINLISHIYLTSLVIKDMKDDSIIINLWSIGSLLYICTNEQFNQYESLSYIYCAIYL